MNCYDTFKEKHRKDIETCLASINDEMFNDNIPFWEKRILDPEYPGYLICFDRRGNLTRDLKPGWFVGRTMYTFGLLYNEIEPREEWFQIMKSGREMIDTDFYYKNGRFNQMLTRDLKIINGATSIFTDHFLIKGLYEYIKALKKMGKDTREECNLAADLTDQLFAHIKTKEVLEQENIPQGMEKHPIYFLTLIVAIESKSIFGDRYQNVIDECIHKTMYEFANDEYKKLFEFIRNDGTPYLKGCGRIMDAGHSMESAWFAMREGIESKNSDYVRRARVVIDWVIDNAYDEENGGFIQHFDVEKKIPEQEFLKTDYIALDAGWDDKIWWVQAEALYALALSALTTKNEKHFKYFMKEFHYIQEYFRDKEYGEWYSVLKKDGSILLDHKGFELKGPYHVLRCLIMLKKLFEDYLQKEESL